MAVRIVNNSGLAFDVTFNVEESAKQAEERVKLMAKRINGAGLMLSKTFNERLKIDNSVLASTAKAAKAQEALNKVLLQETKISTENARQKLLEAQAREKNAKAADIEARTLDRSNKPKKVSQMNDADFAAYSKKVMAAGNVSLTPKVDNTSNIQAINEEIVATNNLSSAYQKQQAEKLKLEQTNATEKNSFFDISETYSKNASYLATLQNELKETQVAMRSKTGTTAELSAREKQLKIDIQAVEKEMAAEYKAFIATGTSVDQLKAKIQLLQKEYNALSIAERNGAKGMAITTEINAAKAAMEDVGKKSTGMGTAISNSVSTAWGALKKFAYLIPGLGIAGLIGFIVDAFVDMIKTSSLFKKSITDIERAHQSLQQVSDKAIDSYVEQKVTMENLIDRVGKGSKTYAEQQSILKTYNKEFGDTIGKAKTYADAEDVIINKGKAFIEAITLRAKAMASLQLATEEAKKQILLQTNPERSLDWMDEVSLKVNRWLASHTKVGSQAWQDAMVGVKSFKDLAAKQANEQITDSEKSMKSFNGLYQQFSEQAEANAEKNKFNFDGKTKNARSQIQDIYNDTKALNDLLAEISGSKNKYKIEFESNTESESDKINKYFDDLTKKVDEFNKDPKRRFKIDMQKANSNIEDSRQYALGLAVDKESGDELLKQLDEQKKLYEDYENFKNEYGEQAAQELYGNLTGKYKTYLERLQAEYNKLDKKGQPVELGGGGGLNPAESNLFSKITEKLTQERQDETQKNLQWQAQAVGQYATYEQRKQGVIVHYAQERKRALETGHTELLSSIDKAEKDELKSLQASNSEKLASAEQYTQGIIYLAKKAAQQQLDILNNLLSSKGLPEAAKNDLQKKADDLSNLINKPEQQFSNNQLDEEIKKQEVALAALAVTGDTTSDSFKKINDEIIRLKNQKAENSIQGIDNALSVLSQLTPAFNDLSSALAETDNNTANQIGGVFASLASGGMQLLETFKKIKTEGVTTVDAIGAAAQFVISTIASIVSSAQAQKKAYEDFYIQNLAFQHDYNTALLEEIRLREGIKNSVFFTDYAGKIKAGLAAEIKAVNDYNEALLKLKDSQVITRTKKVRDWGAVTSSTLSGAAAGGIIGANAAGVGAIPGAVVGAVVGFVSGMFKKRTVVNVYDGLLKTYPKLIDEQGNLNKAMADAIISSGKIEGSSKENLQYLISMNEQYEAAKEQIEGVIADLAGSLGSDLMGSLFDDWANGGKNAGQAFADGVNKSIANVAKNLLFNAVFGDDFVALQDKIKQGFKTNGDPNAMVTSLVEFSKSAQAKGQQFEDMLTEFQKQLNSQGIKDVFNIAGNNDKSNNSVSGAIQQITQQQADVLTGQFYAQTTVLNDINNKIPKNYFTDSISMMNRQFDALYDIKTNTGNTVDRLDKAVVSLQSIDKKMNNTANQAAAAGYKI